VRRESSREKRKKEKEGARRARVHTSSLNALKMLL
jgi:hypothetical protein